ncbi:putative plant intracellular Ras-group-related LRR protein 7-like [Capsicum annuum]|nr:putative plant intracellular Ras-group-related LRR protein 7-like [Capsicum annuum]
MSSSDSSFWKEVVNSEIDSILSNHKWELVDLPLRNKPLGSKWIFKRKMKANGTIDKYKARLVVKGFKQKEGLDYFDTYLLVTRITSILMLIALAAVYDLQIHQMDVKTAFLNGDLKEEIYMEQPEGFVVPGKENKSKFNIKDLGVTDVILGIRIHRTPQGLALSQSHYIEKVLDKFKYMEFGIAKTPLDVSFALRKNEDKAGEEAEWLRNFLKDIPYWPKPVAPVCIHCDSQAAIGRAGSMMYNSKSRHIRRRHNTVRELLSSGIITIDYVKSKDNVSDPLTKGLSREGVERTSKGMNLRSRTSQHGVRPIEDDCESFPLTLRPDERELLGDGEFTYGTTDFRVFQVDLAAGKVTETNELRDMAFFLGANASLSVQASQFPGIKPNHIYFTDDCFESYTCYEEGGGLDMGVFNVADGSIQPHYDGVSLSWFCPPIWVTPTL